MEQSVPKLLFLFCSLSALLISLHPADALLAFMDKNVYEVNETGIIKINRTMDVNMTGIVLNRTSGNQTSNFTLISDGSLGMIVYTHTFDLPEGSYAMNITDGTDAVAINFLVATEILRPQVRLMGFPTPIFVNTSWNITAGDGGLGGNFSELFAFNKSGPLHYGNISSLGDGRNYHFVVFDKNAAGALTTPYMSTTTIRSSCTTTRKTTLRPRRCSNPKGGPARCSG